MYEYLITKYKNAEIEAPLSIEIINELSKESLIKFSTSLPRDYQIFLCELNGFFCNGYAIFGCYNDEMIRKDEGLSGLDFLSFNDRFRDYSDIEDYLILGKSSIDYIAYEISTQQYVLLSNGTLDVLYQSDSFSSVLIKYFEDL